MGIYEQIQQLNRDIDEMTDAAAHIRSVMSNPNSTNEDVEAAIQNGIQTLNDIEDRRIHNEP